MRFEPLETRLMLDAGPLLISELMAVNDSTLADEDGNFSDWIEIHNPTAETVALEGWYLSDESDDLTKWRFPAVTVEAGGDLVVFASDKNRTEPQGELHTNFKLASSGEYLALIQPDGSTIAHEYAPGYPEQSPDVSYGLAAEMTTLLSDGVQLAFTVPTADDEPQQAAWPDPDFDDSTWVGRKMRSPVLITEAGTRTPDWFEIQSVSAEVANTAGWVVAVNNGSGGLHAVHDTFWELPASMPVGEVLYVTDDEDDNYFGTDISWRTTGAGWVMLVDDRGNVADFVAWGYDTEDVALLAVNVNGFDITVADVWQGSAVAANDSRSKTLKRTGDSDHDTAADWAFTEPHGQGEQNEGLLLPFAGNPTTGLGFGPDAEGFADVIQTDVGPVMRDVNTSLWTRIPFEVDDFSTFDLLQLRIKYNDGFVAYLNGQEIARRNAPASLGWNSAATASRSVAESLAFEEINVSDALGILQTGENLLAIQGLSAEVADDDFLMVPTLVGANTRGVEHSFDVPTPWGPNSVGAIVINEVHYDPEFHTEFSEFIELHNMTSNAVDLSGWRLENGVDYAFLDGATIPANGYLVIAEDPPTISSMFGISAIGPWTGRLENDGERIVLRNPAGHRKDEVDYRSSFPWPTIARGEGSSMELIDPALDNDLGGNWRPSGFDTALPPTPGALNSVFSLDAAPAIRQVKHAPQQPATGEPVVVTAKVSDAEGVDAVRLSYQLVAPGDYIPAYLPLPHSTLLSKPNNPFDPNVAFEDPANWTVVAMVDDGTGPDTTAGDGVYAAVIPGQPDGRTLVRYRVTATDTGAISATAPYPDDPSLNFAYYVYDGVPAYEATQRSVHADGAGHVYDAEVMNSLPVYTVITRASDVRQCMNYTGGYTLPKSNERARDRFNWEATFVYDGVVYDHIHYRLRQANDRYGGGDGKRAMRFRFNRGHYLEAHDNYGNSYPQPWRTLNTGKMFDNKDVLNFGLTETLNHNLWNLMGVPAPWMHTFQLRVVDGPDEAPSGANSQYLGDFWGMAVAVEDYDTRFLATHNLPDGNLYKLKDPIKDGNQLRRNQGRYATTDDDDFQNIRHNLRPDKSDQWLNDHVNYDRWYAYHAVVEAIRHYDFRPADSHLKNRAWFFEPKEGTPYGLLWTLPWDSDASWGPNWNSGEDYSKNSIFGGGGKPAFKQEYRNAIREFRDLVWTEEVIYRMIDDLAAIVADFSQADRDRWWGGPADVANQGVPNYPIEWKVQNMKEFAFEGWSGSTGPTVPAGGRAAYLDGLANAEGDATNIPHTPTITSTSAAGFPVDALSFRTTPFSDPQGNQTFAAMQWRAGEVTDPAAPAYDPTQPRVYEMPAVWRSDEITTFDDQITIPSGALEPGHAYRFRVRTKDTSGRWSHWSEPVQLIAGEALEPLTAGLRITEIMYHPSDPTPEELAVDPNLDKDEFEFIELRNTGDATVDLAGVRFTDAVQFDFSTGSVDVLQPGEYVVVVGNAAAFEARYGTAVPVAGEYSARLANNGEAVRLVDGNGEDILVFEYTDTGSWPGKADGKGASLELIDPTSVPADQSARTAYLSGSGHWRSSSEYRGTPGAAGEGPRGDVVVNEVLSHTDPPQLDAVELHNTTNAPIDLGGWYLSDSWGWESNPIIGNYKKYRIEPGTVIGPGEYLVFDEADFNPNGAWNANAGPAGNGEFAFNGVDGDDVWLMEADTGGTLTRFVDHVGFMAAAGGESFGRWPDARGDLYPMTGTTLGSANSGPRVGPVVISEVHYNPGDLAAADDLEFIEIHNPTDQVVDLAGWRIRGGIDYDFAQGTEMATGGTLLVLPFDPQDPANEAAWVAFSAEYGLDAGELHGVVGGYSGRLSNTGERVQLQRPGEPPAGRPQVIPSLLEDEVDYSAMAPWPAAPEGGQSLHRLQSELWGNDPASWDYGTPTPGSAGAAAAAAVADRYVFYNNSAFDDPARGLTDDDAVATDKRALLPGQEATLANYTSYARGINGVMVDVAGLVDAASLSEADFRFRVGNHEDGEAWPAAPAPQSVTVRPGAGVDGSARVTIVWDDNAIARQWLQVTVLATAGTGLAEDDVFYFGNAVGEAGNSTLNAIVNATDESAARNSQRGPTSLADIENRHDFNRDRLVNTTDRTIARTNQTGPVDALRLIAAPAADAVLEQAAGPDLDRLEVSMEEIAWLDEIAHFSTAIQPAEDDGLAERVVDELWIDPQG